MRPFRFLPLAAVALLSPLAAAAQTEHDAAGWVNLTAQGRIAAKGAYFVEIQPRLHDAGTRLDQLMLRTAIGYRVTATLTLFQGYAHVEAPVVRARDLNEERSFQQASWVVPGLARGELSSRTRFEQRWRSDGADMQLRLREMVRYEHPLGRDAGVRALTWVEGFWALNAVDWRPRAGFDRVRGFVGAEIPIGGASTLEAGYLNQIVDHPGRLTRMDHVAALSLFWRL